jgi:hypothetical protein
VTPGVLVRRRLVQVAGNTSTGEKHYLHTTSVDLVSSPPFFLNLMFLFFSSFFFHVCLSISVYILSRVVMSNGFTRWGLLCLH